MLKRSFYLVFDKQSIAKASVDWNWWTQLGSVTSSLNFLLGQQSFGPSTTLFGINALFCCEEQIYNFLKPISEKQEKEQKSLFQQLSFLFVFFRRWWKAAAAASLKVTQLYKIFFVTCGCSTACNQDIVGLAVVVAQVVVHWTTDWEVQGLFPAAAGSWAFFLSLLFPIFQSVVRP